MALTAELFWQQKFFGAEKTTFSNRTILTPRQNSRDSVRLAE
jgi:hypothetical protein